MSRTAEVLLTIWAMAVCVAAGWFLEELGEMSGPKAAAILGALFLAVLGSLIAWDRLARRGRQ